MKQPEDSEAAAGASPDAGSDSRPAKAKKPYQKPAVRHERVFETRALTCGKVQTTQQACAHNRKTS